MDLLLLGEGEEMVPELCDLIILARAEGWSRSRLIREAVAIPGIYAPSLYAHDATGALKPLCEGLPTPGRRIVADFDTAAYPGRCGKSGQRLFSGGYHCAFYGNCT